MTAIRSRSDEIEAVQHRIAVAVDRLREYRSALITAAVTGQLDLRKHEEKMEALA